jgi:hypothetical protein
MLKEDGVFYLQIAGLRRAWQYEDLVWGLFMGQSLLSCAWTILCVCYGMVSDVLIACRQVHFPWSRRVLPIDLPREPA